MPRKPASDPAPRVRHSPMEHPRHQYPNETVALEKIALACGLSHQIKWGKPCFTLNDKNVVLIQRFNHYVALLFFKGALLNDPDHLLARIGTQNAPRQLRFTSTADIARLAPAIRDFIAQAIELEKSGASIERKQPSNLAVPDELQSRLNTDPALKKAFSALTPGRQKAYLYHIAAAKQSATRASRVDKCVPRILAGKGLND